MTDFRRSWQLGHFSPLVPAGDYWTIHPPAGANWRTRVIVPFQAGVIAVQVTENGRSYCYLPGGGIEDHETLPECARREVLEETFLTIAIKRLLYVREYPELNAVEFYMLAEYLSGKLGKGYNPEPEARQFDAVKVLSFEDIEQDQNLIFYPETLRQRLRSDMMLPPTTALYIGRVP